MINSLKIQNFQSHKKSILEFSKGVNIIVGESDTGKSAILRTIKWVVKNKPSGESFRSKWGGETKVDLNLSNSHVIREKTDSDNLYYLDGEAFKSFGTGVPDEVSKVLNIDDINLKSQLSSHFLLSQSPGEVAAHFNKIAGLDQIDQGTKNIRKWINELNRAIKFHTEQKSLLEESLKEYEYLDQLENEVEKIEWLEKQVDEIDSQVKNGLDLIDRFDALDQKIKENNKIVKADQLLSEIEKLNNDKKSIEQQVEFLISRIEEYEVIRENIAYNQNLLEAEPILDSIKEKKGTIEELDSKIVHLENTIERYDELQGDIENKEWELTEMEKEFHKNIGEICPLCGQEIK